MRSARSILILTFVLILLLGTGCEQDVADRAIVDQLRILAVQAEPPEVAPGGAVSLSALVADPYGNGRTLAWMWALCTPDPLVGPSSCGEAGRTLPLGLGTALTHTLPSDALDGLPLDERERGLDAFVVLVVEAPANDDESEGQEIAFKRVHVSTNVAPNTNPAIEAFFVHGAPEGDVGAREGDLLPLAASVDVDSLQIFVDPLGDPQVEEIKYSWFATAGRFERGLTFGDPVTGETENGWHVPDDLEPTDLWLVARDPRGGVDWRWRHVVP